MSTSSHTRALRTLNTHASPSRPVSLKTLPKAAKHEPTVFGRIPLSAIRNSTAVTSTSPGGTGKCAPTSVQRHSSTISLGNIFPRRKSLQTTAIASRRQSLWMNIARNASATNDVQPMPLPLRNAHSSLMRKKILRLLLVFSYLLSISLLAIALATFYGFFWAGYGTPPSTSVPDVRVTTRSMDSALPNGTMVDPNPEIEFVS